MPRRRPEAPQDAVPVRVEAVPRRGLTAPFSSKRLSDAHCLQSAAFLSLTDASLIGCTNYRRFSLEGLTTSAAQTGSRETTCVAVREQKCRLIFLRGA